MEENKQVTAEAFYMAVQERECPWRNNYILPDSWQLKAMEEYATLKNQQLQAENERLREVNKELQNRLNKAELLTIVIHDETAKLPVPMEKYTPISKLLIDLKTLLRASGAGINLTP